MGICREKLSCAERERIARALLAGCDSKNAMRIGAHCPFHTESTPGGAFYYSVEQDLAYCYSCQAHGDLIDVYAQVRGLPPDAPETFRAFFEEFAPSALGTRHAGGPRHKPGAAHAVDSAGDSQDPDAPAASWEPTPVLEPSHVWAQHATKFVSECADALQKNDMALGLLQGLWGITPETAKNLRIGWNDKDSFRAQKGWGLPDELNKNGRPRCIAMPAGYVFPVFGETKLLRVKIRVENPGQGKPRYMAVRGGSPNSYLVCANTATRVFVVVETERDAMYLWQELWQYGVGAMAAGTARLAPDARAHSYLSRAELVLNALDNDAAGARASWLFGYNPSRFSWNQTYAHCVRWPVPAGIGKDPGDMFGKLRPWDWVAAAMPSTMVAWCEKTARAGLGGAQ